MLLSVIIPVYKVEQTLDRCVKSVLRQSVDDMEIILVDDGSPDDCPQMCDEWAGKDDRIKVIHKGNGGLSDARNAGLDVAVGEYITFVDSDDYLLEDTLRPLMTLLNERKEVSVLEYGIWQDDAERHNFELQDCVFDTGREYWLSTRAWSHAYACNKIYRRELFEDCKYPKGRIFEDLLLLPLLLNKCGKVMTVSRGTYIYTVNDDGISKSVTVNSVYQLLRAEMSAAWNMRTMPWSVNGRNLYYYMCCRCYDILRLLLGVKS